MIEAGRRMYANAVGLVAIGFSLGGLLAISAPLLLDSGMEKYDQLYPVISATAVVLSETEDEVVVRMAGQKRRSCSYIGLSAYVPSSDGAPGSRVFLRKMDTPETGETRPIGALDMGIWQIWPVRGADGVEIYAQHVCSGRVVVTVVARLTRKDGEPGRRSDDGTGH